jgi:hypothetical protein
VAKLGLKKGGAAKTPTDLPDKKFAPKPEKTSEPGQFLDYFSAQKQTEPCEITYVRYCC